MKIMGLGSDLVNVRRIRHSLDHLGRPWVNKILSPAELGRAPSWDNAEYVAKLFAAKEACSKALGTGMTAGVQWTCIEIELPGTARLSKGALRRMNAIAGRGQQGLIVIDTFCKDGVAGATAIFFGAAL